MLNQLSNVSLWLIIACAILTPTCIILGFGLASTKKQLKIVTNLMLETKETCLRSTARSYNSQDELREQIQKLSAQVNSLSSSNELVIKELHTQRKQKIYPRPDLVDQITKTIEDQIAIEMMLSVDLMAPRAGYLERITDHVVQTYPEVDVEYIASKVTAILHTYNKQRKRE